MSVAVATTLDFGGSRRITGLPAAIAAGQPVILEQLNAAIEGLGWKDNARVDATVNVNLASPGATINGVTMDPGDRFVTRAQTAGSENGIYIWNAAATPATRSLDASTFDELENAVVAIDEGPNAGSLFRQTAVNGTLGTTAVTWASFLPSTPGASETTAGVAEIATQAETDAGADDLRIVTPAKLANWSGRYRRNSANIGDGTATLFTVTHNFNSRDVQATVYENAGLYREVIVEIRRTGVNFIDIVFDQPPTANAYRVVIGL